MKKLLFLIVLVFLFSCEKEQPVFCWECRGVVLSYNLDDKIIDEWHITLPNYTEDQVESFLKKENRIFNDTIRVVTICRKIE